MLERAPSNFLVTWPGLQITEGRKGKVVCGYIGYCVRHVIVTQVTLVYISKYRRISLVIGHWSSVNVKI